MYLGRPYRYALLAAGLLVPAFVLAADLPSIYRAPRTPDGKPDLNGIWQAVNEANWNIEGHAAGPGTVVALGAEAATPPGIGIVEDGLIPYLPAAAAKQKE